MDFIGFVFLAIVMLLGAAVFGPLAVAVLMHMHRKAKERSNES